MGKVLMMGGGGGGDGSDDCTATTAEVLTGYTAITSDSDDEAVGGKMTNNGAISTSLNAGGSYTIPKGYHNGSGKVTANSLSSQTSGTATASDILSGKTAWVSGSQITGNIASLAGGTYTPSTSQQTISSSGKYMTSNVIISAIPSNYLDITNGQSVFLNGAFGAIVNHSYKTGYYYSSSGVSTWTTNAPYIGTLDGHSGIVFEVGYNNDQRRAGLIICGSIDMSKFSSMTVSGYIGHVLTSTYCMYLFSRVINPSSLTALNTAQRNMDRSSYSDGDAFTSTLDLSGVNQHAYIMFDANRDTTNLTTTSFVITTVTLNV